MANGARERGDSSLGNREGAVSCGTERRKRGARPSLGPGARSSRAQLASPRRFAVEAPHDARAGAVSAGRRSPSAGEDGSRKPRKDWRSPLLRGLNPGPVRPLPALPAIRLVVAHDRGAEGRALGGFLDVRRLQLVLQYPDGSSSAPFPYDVVARAALDAVVIAACYLDAGVPHVFLRSAVRPPCALRPISPDHDGALWELPAGLVEPGEDPAVAAARELEEELGFVVSPAALRPLGAWTFPVPGMIGERHLFYVVDVDPAARSRPGEDGSALERGAAIVALPVADALEHCRRGDLRDAKTELALRRLAEVLP
jgi:ADP-ribose pyrophosphatase